MFRKVCLFYLVSILIIVSCNNPEKAFKEAEELNTIEAYQGFIKNYSDSVWINKAENRIIDLEYEETKKLNTIDAYNSFTNKYPQNNYIEEINNLIYDLKFEIARNKNTSEAYEGFINEYPEGKYTQEAQDSIYLIEYDKVKNSNALTAYLKYIKKYPNNPYISKSLSKPYSEAIKYIKEQDLINLKKIYGKVASIDSKKIGIQFDKLIRMGNMQVYSLGTSTLLCYFPEKISVGDIVEIYGLCKRVMESPYDDWITVYIRLYKKKS